jgi:hypothetical protein
VLADDVSIIQGPTGADSAKEASETNRSGRKRRGYLFKWPSLVKIYAKASSGLL